MLELYIDRQRIADVVLVVFLRIFSNETRPFGVDDIRKKVIDPPVFNRSGIGLGENPGRVGLDQRNGILAFTDRERRDFFGFNLEDIGYLRLVFFVLERHKQEEQHGES